MQCKAKSKQTGERCKNKAVTGWQVCRMHGAKGGRPVKHGMYSNKVNTSLQGVYQEFIEEVDNIADLSDDIALLRAMMVTALQDEPQNPQEKNNQINTVLRFMRDIRYTIELKDDVESKYMVSIETVHVFMNQLLFILKKHIKDDDLLQKIMMDMRQVKLLDQETEKPKKLRDAKRRRG